MTSLSRYFSLLLLLLALGLPWQAKAQIYADVTVSGAVSGTFTISLKYTNAPVTTANFIGLATGKKAWIDGTTGAIHNTPYYNGVTFHRVIASFMSQTGSRTGDGTDGPGYIFRNEIDPTLTHGPYTVAMANAGINTNGAQFYIVSKTISTSVAASLDGSYSIFGVVTSGTSVCDAINSLTTDANDKPLTPVTINSIKIYGPSYAGFNIAQSALPVVVSARPVMKVSGTSYSLGFDHNAYSYYIGFHSADLGSWTNYCYAYCGASAPSAGDLDVSSVTTGNKHFYSLTRVDYTRATNLVAGKTLVFGMPLTTPWNVVTCVVHSDTATGTWSNGTNNGTMTCSYDGSLPYQEQLYMIWSNEFQFLLTLNYNAKATGGTYSGQTNLTSYPTVSGTFSSSP